MNKTMLDMSRGDLMVVHRLMSFPLTDDDMVLESVGYHLQQSAEKSLKAVLEFVGEDYRAMGHSIGKCLRSVLNHAPTALTAKTVAAMQPYINILTDWEVAGRYPSGFLFMLKELRQIQVIVLDLFNECAAYVGEPSFSEASETTDASDTSNRTSGVNTMNLFEKR